MASTMSTSIRQYGAAIRALIVLTIILGVVYPLVVTGIGQVAFSKQANGSLLEKDGVVIGSSLIGQSFSDADGNPLPEWFQPRPSAAGDGYDLAASSASNLGPNNPDLVAAIEERRAQVAEFNNVDPASVPPDALTASGSGLDPHISPAYAKLQVARVAETRGIDPATVESLVDEYTVGRGLGFLGGEGVNVLELNLALSNL